MTVYIARKHYNCEGYNILGVYLTRQEAVDRIADIECPGDSHDVLEVEIGQEMDE